MLLSPSIKREGSSRKAKLAAIFLGKNTIAKFAEDANTNISSDKQEWKDLLKACDEQPYSIKELDAIGEKITDAITPGIRAVIGGVKAVMPAAQNVGEKAIQIGESLAKGSNHRLDRISKLASIFPGDIDQISLMEKGLIRLAADEGVHANSLEDLSLKYHNISKRADMVGEVAGNSISLLGKGIKGVGKGLAGALPYVGIITDATLLIKNANEAWVNGGKVVSELPLAQYGIAVEEATIPTPGNTRSLGEKLLQLTEEYKDSAADLKNILTISQTLKAYSTDLVSTITNSIMVIIDILELLPVLGAMASFILSLPVIAVEMASDSISEESYEKSIENIRSICQSHLSEDISDSQKSFISEYLKSDPEGNEDSLAEANAASKAIYLYFVKTSR
jgi:hypothetical protein